MVTVVHGEGDVVDPLPHSGLGVDLAKGDIGLGLVGSVFGTTKGGLFLVTSEAVPVGELDLGTPKGLEGFSSLSSGLVSRGSFSAVGENVGRVWGVALGAGPRPLCPHAMDILMALSWDMPQGVGAPLPHCPQA